LTLFGQTLQGPEIAALVSMLLVLVLWTMRLKGDREWVRWFRQWEADRKARRDAEIAAENGETPGPGEPRGPWG
jgi:predicted PurR-regulated permease PerM